MKQGTRVKTKKWDLQWDLTSGIRLGLVRGSKLHFPFPPHIAFTELGSDIFSNKLKRVMLIELICPCEKKKTKANKYMPLKSINENDGV